MAVDTTQLIADAQCIFACMSQGMIQAAQLGQMAPASLITTTVVPQTAGVSLLMAANPKRRRAVIQNLSAGAAFAIGPSTVTSATGFTIGAGATNPLSRLEVFTQGELYEVGGTAGQNIVVMEYLVP